MKYDEAKNFIRCLLPGALLISFRYENDVWKDGSEKVKCGIIFVYDDNREAESFYSDTWQGLINKIQIYLVPKGTPSSEEAPEEAAQDTASTDGQQPAAQKPEAGPSCALASVKLKDKGTQASA